MRMNGSEEPVKEFKNAGFRNRRDMSYIIPSRDVSTEDKKIYRKATADELISRALKYGFASSREGLTIRDIFPLDLGLQDWSIKQTGWVELYEYGACYPYMDGAR